MKQEEIEDKFHRFREVKFEMRISSFLNFATQHGISNNVP